MAREFREPKRCVGIELTDIHCRFFPAGAANPTGLNGLTATTGGFFGSGIKSVTYVSQALYTIAFKGKHRQVRGMVASVQLNAVADAVAQFGAFTVGTGSVDESVLLRLHAAGAVAADVAANANNSVSAMFTFADTDVAR